MSWLLADKERTGRHGQRASARRPTISLAPIYDWFTESFISADLKDAKALLDELA
jgi:hypothetical protein